MRVNGRKGNSEVKAAFKTKLPPITGNAYVRPSNSTMMKLPTKKTLSKISIPQIFSSTELQPSTILPKKTTEILLLIESIYGKSENVILGSVDILASNRNVLQISSAELAITNKEAYNLEKLYDRTMMKLEAESFHHPWEGQPVGIKFNVIAEMPPTIMRIFNPKDGFEGHVERFSVYINKKCICTDVIPSDYGKHISIVNSVIIDKPLIAEFLADKRNQVPMFPIILSNSVQINLIESFNGKSSVFSVNCFELVDQDGRRIKLDRIQKIQVAHANISVPLESLIQRKEKNKYILIQSTKPDQKPKIRFTFIKPIRVAFVRIINYVSIEAKDSAITKLKIICGDRVSKYSKCVFSPTHIKDDVVVTTDVYFIDKIALRWADHNSNERNELSAFGPFMLA